MIISAPNNMSGMKIEKYEFEIMYWIQMTHILDIHWVIGWKLDIHTREKI
jgi:hypothetical protein